jgi:cytochrome c-type biogenesis protein
MDSIFNWLYNLLYQNDALALISSFVWGLLSVLLSPCHLASIPLIMAYIVSQNSKEKNSSFKLSLMFSLGILSIIFITGIITSLLGGLLGDIGSWTYFLTGAVMIAAGLYFLELININSFKLRSETMIKNKNLTAFMFGLTAGLALGPCTFAFMAPVFAYALESAKSKPVFSFGLFLLYGTGHCAVILAAGMLSSKIQKYLSWAGSSKGLLIFRKICGVMVLLGGIYIIYLGASQ